MSSYDPDVDDPYLEPTDEGPTRVIASEVDEDHALAVLDAVTADLPGGGEAREGQRTMTRLVARALSTQQPVIIEAGTGVGKSLAYLVPAALSGQRVVIATATKNLQDQLATKDAPLVTAHAPGTRLAVLKGKSNYLCRNRAAQAGPGQLAFDDGERVPRGVASQMRRILAWANDTATGERDELTFDVDERAWRSLSVSPQECLGRLQCPQGQSCFAELAKDRAAEADIVIVNTHLYAAHLASGAMLLPAHDVVVFDEAHEAPDIFASLLGTSLTPTRLRALALGARPLLGPDSDETSTELAGVADRLATSLAIQYDAQRLAGLDEDVERELVRASDLVTRLIESLRALSGADATGEARRLRTLGPAVHLGNDLVRLRGVGEGELIYLTRREREVEIELSLIDVGPRLAEDLWPGVTAVLTSATIPDSLGATLGLAASLERVESPFDYRQHAVLYVPHLPARNDPACERAIIDELVTLIEAAGGRTLALFTNRAVMNRVADAVSDRIATPVLVQGTLSRQRLIAEFRDSVSASLFAVTSFWQGVDVPGHSLSLVTIDRLPFRVPGDPLAEARRERAANPFYDVDLPRAAMLLAQGVGRLIRSATDRGVVAVLDTRLAEANYRGALFTKLPPMRRTRDRSFVEGFLRELSAVHPGEPVVD
ncbi:MAG TPA: ATP-dependent DNA helicase [Acidimicrobiales bacterium]|nr:ATP-dependent DNA helicase [Acidimicrobiales bacterium]